MSLRRTGSRSPVKENSSAAYVRLKCREARVSGCLSLTRRQLAVVCSEAVPLHNVRHLYLSGCGLSGDDLLELARLRHLVTLDVSDNRVEQLPAAACAALVDLEVLDCSRNGLTRLTPAVSHLSRLVELNVSHNDLIYVPSEVGQLARLSLLDASHNSVVGLPENLFLGAMASRLEVLRLAANRLAQLPHSVGELPRLRELDLRSNGLRSLPTSVKRLTAVQALHCQDNPWAGDVGALAVSCFGADARSALVLLSV